MASKNLVQKEIDALLEQGVEIRTNMVIGKVLTIDELFEEGYSAVFIGSGRLPLFMHIPGENLTVYIRQTNLTRINLMKAYKEDAETPIMRGNSVAVVGGGNVAMDARDVCVWVLIRSILSTDVQRLRCLPAWKVHREGRRNYL